MKQIVMEFHAIVFFTNNEKINAPQTIVLIELRVRIAGNATTKSQNIPDVQNWRFCLLNDLRWYSS